MDHADTPPSCPHCGHALSMFAEAPMGAAERAASRVAAVVASWWFSLALATAMVVWIAVNVVWRPFEPYPMIMVAGLAGGLGVISAFYGPLILLTQRRAAMRDRARDRETYLVAARTEDDLHALSAQVTRLARPLATEHADDDGRTDR
ncbi:DUF1003 domain-containing protein [Paraoerskovia marina]|uniref:DUF1003 domain-containing protein n=1 Tax=Paraoerskovia marina TaxID=545619 RepID=UPI0009F313C4|nr:DUF1003 domain-containing protein [Paraoerskovia marina]